MSGIIEILQMQQEWSLKTFGPGMRTEGNCKHIEKELSEIRADPDDIEEWIDVAMLAFDGAWRAGASPEEIWAQYLSKLYKNMRRQWAPPNPEDQPNEHVK